MARSPREIARGVVVALRNAGYVAYFAGGCVRDELLGLHPKDYDIATDATPDDVARLFRRAKEVGRKFGVMLVMRSGVTVEVTTFRREGQYSDKRRPDQIEFADAQSDARRRDFTINALFLDPLLDSQDPQRVIDFVGGLDDLNARILRAVGDPDTRLAEDHLRALRAVRFAARLGLDVEPATRKAITRHARELAGVSRERIGEEVRMMLGVPSRGRAVKLLNELGLAGPVLEEEEKGAGDKPEGNMVASLPADAGFGLALAAWAVDRAGGQVRAVEPGGVASRWRRALCLSNDEHEELRAILSTAVQMNDAWADMGIALRKRLAASREYRQALAILRIAAPKLSRGIERDVEILTQDGIGLAPPPLVTGDDLVAAGYAPGPEFGRWLEEAYNSQLEGGIRAQYEAMAFIASRAKRASEAG